MTGQSSLFFIPELVKSGQRKINGKTYTYRVYVERVGVSWDLRWGTNSTAGHAGNVADALSRMDNYADHMTLPNELWDVSTERTTS